MNTNYLFITNIIAFNSSYLIGVVISLFLLGYLLYSLIKPEKF